MNSMLLKQDILSKKEGDQVAGLVYIQSYTDSVTKDGRPYFNGVVQCQGNVSFKVWSNALCFKKFETEDFREKIVYVEGTVDLFNGVALKLNKIAIPDNCQFTVFDFFEEKYDVSVLCDELFQMFHEHCSEEAMEVFRLLTHDDMTKDVWLDEFAAIGHHDAVRHGLLAHSTKVARIMGFITNMYPNIHDALGDDLIFVGSALHDIGKCWEYHNGGMSRDGEYASHLSLGIVLVSKYQADIERLKGHEFYMNLLSIVSQHHGAHGENPRTLIAYLIHVIDALEANFAKLEEIIGPTLGTVFHTLKTSPIETGEWTIKY